MNLINAQLARGNGATRMKSTHRRFHGQIAGLATVVLAASGVAASPAYASSAPPRVLSSSSSTRGHLTGHGSASRPGWASLTVQLTPSRPAVLTALARSHGLSPESRHAALVAAAPSPNTASAVEGFLIRAGLTISARTAFSVTASGPAALINSLFPMAPRRSAAAALRVGRAEAAGASPLIVPSALSGLASFIVGGADTSPVAHPLKAGPMGTTSRPSFAPGLITGPTARSLYSVPAGATTQGGMGITIATIQLSGWDNSNLTTFAANVGLPDPVSSFQYQALSVDGASTSTPDGNGGDIEFALDQETLLTVAPQADQVAYVAPNTLQGFTDAFNAVANDALTNTVGLKFTALSVSWGACEAHWPAASMNAMDAAIQNVAAAGVTVFVATGDYGAYDCSTPSAPVDSLAVGFPSSDPNVLAVGGLTTDPVASNETSWWTPTGNPSPGFLGEGGGGGQSSYWPMPTWQNGIYPGATARLVPDLSLDADPASGEQIRAQGSWVVYGGTSLAAPLGAATMTDLQIVDGASSAYGLGNIAQNLYGAPASSFRDTTSGSNGYFLAGTGYDLATGRGAPLWSRLDTAILGTPILSVPVTSTSFTIPISVTVPSGMIYTGFKGGVGATTEPTVCDPAGDTVSPPTSEIATQYGSTVIWVVGYTASGRCFISVAPVDVITAPVASTFTAAGPCRVLDTRTGNGNCPGSVSAAAGPVGAGGTLQVKVAGVAAVPTNATAVVVNLTATGATKPTYVTAWPDGQPQPTVSNLNVVNANATPNLAVVPVGADGYIDLYNRAGTVNLVVDISGYFAP